MDVSTACNMVLMVSGKEQQGAELASRNGGRYCGGTDWKICATSDAVRWKRICVKIAASNPELEQRVGFR